MRNRTLVVHPLDHSTRFLELVYRGTDAAVLTGQVSRAQLRSLMQESDQVVMLGHGSADGLFSVGQFPSCNFVVDATFTDVLREKKNSIFIWCFAADFVRKNQLYGVATGMFISEAKEAEWFGVTATDAEINESNHLFAGVVGRFANQHPQALCAALDREYGKLAESNPVAAYNHPRLRLFDPGDSGDEVIRLHEASVNLGP